jgi:hypothetical protein
VSKEIDTSRSLRITPLVERILWLNAQGLGATVISKALDRNRAYVSHVINHPDAAEQRRKYAEIQAAKLEPIIQTLKQRYAQLHNKAADRLEELLDAELEDGTPNIGARSLAIKLLFGSRVSASLFGTLREETEVRDREGAIVNLHFTVPLDTVSIPEVIEEGVLDEQNRD